MLSINLIRENPTHVVERLAFKHFREPQAVITQLIELDTARRNTIQTLEQARAEMNTTAKKIGIELAQKNTEAADALKAQTAALKLSISENEASLSVLEEQLHNLLVTLPNLPHPSVPPGKAAEDNVVIFEEQRTLHLPPNALPHWDLVKQHGIIDFELGNKITGAGFPVYIGQGARLQRALIQFFLDEAVAAGYTEVQPPILVNAASGFGTGQLPDKEGQMYFVNEDALYLVPTAEVPITNLYRDVIMEGTVLPVKNCGYTPCFRREAGSYGKDVRGLNRLHQFDKVELVQVVHPEQSYTVLEEMLAYVSGLLHKLELPYRQLLLSGGDMTFSSAKTYDLEVYSGAQARWLEVSSVSNFEAYQATRLKLRYREAGEKKGTALAHTLNGSALALPRIVAALLENNQLADGRIRLPQVLVPYTGFEVIGKVGT